MIREPLRSIKRNRIRPAFLALVALLASLVAAPQLFSDEPYARSRDYDLQHSKISLRFDLDNKKVLGEVTHSLAILRDGTAKIVFDSAGLTIHRVTVNKDAAKFETTAEKLIIPLALKLRLETNSKSLFGTKASQQRECTSSCRTRIIQTGPAKSGRKANRKIRITTCRPTTIRMTG